MSGLNINRMDSMLHKLAGIQRHIRFKAIVMIVATTLIGSVTLVVLTKTSMDKGFLRYVNSAEQVRVDQLTTLLEQHLAGYLDRRENPHYWWPTLVNSTRSHESEQWKRPISEYSYERPERAERFEGFERSDNIASGEGFGPARPAPPGFHERRPPPPPRYQQWDSSPPKFDEAFDHSLPPPRPAGRAGGSTSIEFEQRVMLLDADKHRIIGPPNHADEVLYPIYSQGELIAYLGHISQKSLVEATEVQFVEEFNYSLLWIWLVSCAVTLAVAYPWANSLIRTIEVFNKGVRQLAQGTYGSRVTIERKDELGQLATDINHLATVLERNEKARQQWIADISHELRNPIAIMQAEVEAVQDGVRENSDSTIKSLHYNVTHLSHLVNDLYELSMSDIGALTYTKFRASPIVLLEQCVDLYRDAFDEKSLSLSLIFRGNAEAMKAMLLALDQNRIQQLFSNLLKNSLKYTDAGGGLEVVCSNTEDKQLVIEFNDSSPGLTDKDLVQVFERLYRVDPSRHRNTTGGAGLGLSICKSIAEAHGMTLTAGHSSLGGVSMKVVITWE